MNSGLKIVVQILFLVVLFSSCTTKGLSLVTKEDVFQEKIDELEKNGLDQYPLIKQCLPNETSKECFERELKNHLTYFFLKYNPNYRVNTELDKELVLTFIVNNEGQISIKNRTYVFDHYEELGYTIEHALEKIHPIRPGMVGDSYIGGSFKLPIVFNE